MDLERHTFKFMEIAKRKKRVKVYDSDSGKEITTFIANFLKIESFSGDFDEVNFYKNVLPDLISSYHVFGNKVMMELYKIETKKSQGQ